MYPAGKATAPRWRRDINYSARTAAANFDALPASEHGDYCGVILIKASAPRSSDDVAHKGGLS